MTDAAGDAIAVVVTADGVAEDRADAGVAEGFVAGVVATGVKGADVT